MSQTLFKPSIHTAPIINGRCKAGWTSQNQRQNLSFPIAHGRRSLRLKSSPSVAKPSYLVVKGQQAAVCGVGLLEKVKVKPLLDIDVVTEFAVKAGKGLRTTCLEFFEFAVGGELGGGGGGDDGNNDNRGGGRGGGDDDDYIDDYDDDDDDDDSDHDHDEILDRETVDAILKEWQKTLMDLPPALQQAYEMGMVSSTQLVKFLAMSNVTPTTRLVSLLPRGLRECFGRMLAVADPALLHRLFLEQILITCCSIWWEVKQRGGRINEEWDLALINLRKASVCNAVVFAGSMLTLVHRVSATSSIPAAHRLIRGLNKSSVNYFDAVRLALLFSMGFRLFSGVFRATTSKAAPRKTIRNEDYCA